LAFKLLTTKKKFMTNDWQKEEDLTNNFFSKFSEKYNINYETEDEELRTNIADKLYKELDKFLGRQALNRLNRLGKYDFKTNPLIKKISDFKRLLKREVFVAVVNFVYSGDAVSQKQRDNNYNKLKNNLLTN